MYKKYLQFILIISIIILTGCTQTQVDTQSQIHTIKDNTNLNPQLKEITSNIQLLAQECSSLCRVDQQEYCTQIKELISEDLSKTYGTCRSFSKYNNEFTKCEKFCKKFGHETGCMLENNTKDTDCDGK